MSFPAVASVVLLFVSLPHSATVDAPDTRNLRWVRATVTASTPESLTLKLRDREIVLLRDHATEVVGDSAAAVAIGATVEAHYTDRKGVRRAILLIADGPNGELSKRPSTSARGQMVRVKWGALQVSSGGKVRGGLSFGKKSRLVDREGRLLATGKDEILKIITPDAELLVKYNNEGGLVVEGVDFGGSDNIKEIRLLR